MNNYCCTDTVKNTDVIIPTYNDYDSGCDMNNQEKAMHSGDTTTSTTTSSMCITECLGNGAADSTLIKSCATQLHAPSIGEQTTSIKHGDGVGTMADVQRYGKDKRGT